MLGLNSAALTNEQLRKNEQHKVSKNLTAKEREKDRAEKKLEVGEIVVDLENTFQLPLTNFRQRFTAGS